MNKVSKILSLPIVEIAGGKNMGVASSIVYDFVGKKIYLTLNSQKQGIESVLASGDIIGVGEDYVLIMEEESVVELSGNQEMADIVSRSFFILEKDVVNTQGTRIGMITDLVLSDDGEKIENIVLDDSSQQEIEGSRILSVTDRMVFVKEDGFQNKEKKEAKAESGNTEKNRGNIHIVKVQEAPIEGFLDVEDEKKSAEVVDFPDGLVLTEDVVSEDGIFKAEKGTLITKKVMQEAEEHDALILLAMHSK